MAVVQISKIQHRRGQKNSNSGIPQLSSAEFAWAVDTQELFIGNGSVAEGAPYVGNTKVLTEHDNLLELIEAYEWGRPDPTVTTTVQRSLQSKLDEYVSVIDFGAVGDGFTDDTSAFEAAFTALFKNLNENYRKVLLVPNGEYRFTRDLVIPAGKLNTVDSERNIAIRGETQLGTILNIGSNSIRFTTVDGLEFLDFESTNRPENVLLSNLTVERTSGQLDLSGVANSVVESVRFFGSYELGDQMLPLTEETSAVYWFNDREGVKVDNVKFKSCMFESTGLAVKCVQTAVFDTEVSFDNSEFFVNDTAVYINGVPTQGNHWTFNNCQFKEIARNAFKSTQGQGTVIQNTKFKNTGNGTNLPSTPADNTVYFGESTGNLVINCTSDRQQAAGIVGPESQSFAISEVFNGNKVNFIDSNQGDIFLSDSFSPLAIFSALNKFYTINYLLRLGTHSRTGKLTMTVGEELSEVQITDEFQYSSASSESPGGSIMSNFEFDAVIEDNGIIPGSPDTIVLTYKNPLSTGAEGTISFDVAYGV
jgi:hypothetical protein